MRYNKVYVSSVKESPYLLCMKMFALIIREIQDTPMISSVFSTNPTFSSPPLTASQKKEAVDVISRRVGKLCTEILTELNIDANKSVVDASSLINSYVQSASVEEDLEEFFTSAQRVSTNIVNSEVVIVGKLTTEQEDALVRFFPIFKYVFVNQ